MVVRVVSAPPAEGVEGSLGVGRVGLDVPVEELEGAFILLLLLACGGVGSGVLQSGREGLGEGVEVRPARMGQEGLEVLLGRAAEAGVLPLQLPVHLEGRRRVSVAVGDEGCAVVAVHDGQGFGQGVQRPRAKGARRSLWDG